jgi:hypothetical protein
MPPVKASQGGSKGSKNLF